MKHIACHMWLAASQVEAVKSDMGKEAAQATQLLRGVAGLGLRGGRGIELAFVVCRASSEFSKCPNSKAAATEKPPKSKSHNVGA